MFARTLCIHNPHWEDVEAAIRQLDGGAKDTVMLQSRFDGPHMDICGDGRRFMVTVTRTEHGYVLIDPRRGEHDIEIDFPGGQAVEWPASQVVDLQSVLKAAECFMRSGELDSSVQWQQV